MSQPAVSAPASAGPTGLIDTLQAGFNTINRHLWLLLLPLLVDFLLWLGPQLTIGAALSQWAGSPSGPSAVGPLQRVFGEGDLPALLHSDEIRRYNLFWLLAVPVLGVPSFRAGASGSGIAISLDSLPSLAIAAAAVLATGISLAVAYYGLLGQIVRNRTAAIAAFVPDFGVLWVRAAALFVISMAAILLFAVPVMILLTAAQGAAPALLIVASLLLGVAVWLFVHLFFTADALFVGVVGPVTAVWRSVTVVRHFFWESIGFVGLIVVVTYGMAILLHEVARNLQTTGIVLAIVGHIYLSASVSAASMTYYRERFDRLPTKLTR
ncbi:MAG: hypothetical protein HY534_01215 [Chloroflexi bacterium]|nr:hypothetical protein [Chloroflexota bacterium]